MKVYGYFRSSAAYRLRIALNLKGIEAEQVSVHLRLGEHKQPDFARKNPQKLVPALQIEEGVITQSLAIIEWLDETQSGMKLLPADPFLRAKVRAFAQVIACDIHPLQNLRVLKYLESTYGQDQAGKDQWCQHWLGEGLAACEELVSGEEQYCFGDAPTLADVCLVPQIFSAQRFHVNLDAMPKLCAITARCEALPAFAEAHPDRQPDFE